MFYHSNPYIQYENFSVVGVPLTRNIYTLVVQFFSQCGALEVFTSALKFCTSQNAQEMLQRLTDWVNPLLHVQPYYSYKTEYGIRLSEQARRYVDKYCKVPGSTIGCQQMAVYLTLYKYLAKSKRSQGQSTVLHCRPYSLSLIERGIQPLKQSRRYMKTHSSNTPEYQRFIKNYAQD